MVKDLSFIPMSKQSDAVMSSYLYKKLCQSVGGNHYDNCTLRLRSVNLDIAAHRNCQNTSVVELESSE